MKGWQNT